ncbi:unnamed protein product [Lasius platythorax]|uniref:Uncharacterized protein n=1 Tax=Lasius platythorax TaxID=488582 RepID=A0AAV2NUW8_9HYME
MDAHYDVEVIRANAAALYLRREPAAIISQIMEIQAFLVNAICRKRLPASGERVAREVTAPGSKQIAVNTRRTYVLLGTRHQSAKFFLSIPLSSLQPPNQKFVNHKSEYAKKV